MGFSELENRRCEANADIHNLIYNTVYVQRGLRWDVVEFNFDFSAIVCQGDVFNEQRVFVSSMIYLVSGNCKKCQNYAWKIQVNIVILTTKARW